jgi:hypothetical protein
MFIDLKVDFDNKLLIIIQLIRMSKMSKMIKIAL